MRFVSKKAEHRLIRKPTDRILDEMRRPIILRGERVEFFNHKFHTDDPDIISWLIHHPGYGKDFTSDAGLDTQKYNEDMRKATEFDTRQKKAKESMPKMIFGAIGNANSGMQPLPKEVADFPKETPKPEAEIPVISNPTREEIADMIDKRLESAVAQIITALKPEPTISVMREKRKFHCPECGEEFKTGVAVGYHKKAVHTK